VPENRRQWRILYDRPLSGRWNMALDEAILESVGRGDALPTLRLYAWEPACLSLGISQHASDVDFDELATHGWDLVRRPTGGRAILHTDELTYSVALPISDPIAQLDIVESYRALSAVLMAALDALGAQTQAGRRSDTAPRRPGPVCFEVPSHYEITVEGRKLIGSAQVRKSSGILQHGSLPLWGDLGRICDALAFTDESARDEARQAVRERALTLDEALGRHVSWDEAAERIVEGFSETLGVDWADGGLSDAEIARAEVLAAVKYGDDAHIHAR
jgi:lipoate-protein ligase A